MDLTSLQASLDSLEGTASALGTAQTALAAAVAQAIKDGTPVPQATIDALTTRVAAVATSLATTGQAITTAAQQLTTTFP